MVVVHDDVPGEREPLAGAAPDRLRGEERLEHPVRELRGNAGPRVLHLDDRLPAVHPRTESDRAHPARPAQPLADRVRRVHDEVQEHLVELLGVADDGWQISRFQLAGGHVLPARATDHHRVAEHRVQVCRCHLRPARMSELLHRADDRRHAVHAFERPLDRPGRFFHEKGRVRLEEARRELRDPGVLPQRRGRGGEVRCHLAVKSAERLRRVAQEVEAVADELHGGVDLVRDAAREPPYGLEPARRVRGRFEPSALGHVADHGERARPLRGRHGGQRELHVHLAPIAALRGEPEGAPKRRRVARGGPAVHRGVGVRAHLPGCDARVQIPAEDLVALPPEDLLGGAVPELHAALPIHHRDAVARVLGDGIEDELHLAAPVVRTPQLADVAEPEHHAHRLGGDVGQRREVCFEQPLSASHLRAGLSHPGGLLDRVLREREDPRWQVRFEPGQSVAVIEGSGGRREPRDLQRRRVGVDDPPRAVEDEDRGVEALQHREVAVLLAREGAIGALQDAGSALRVLGGPRLAEAQLDPIEQAQQRLSSPCPQRAVVGGGVAGVGERVAVVLGEPEEHRERDAARAVLQRLVAAESGDRVGVEGLVGPEIQHARVQVRGPPDGVREPAHRRHPGLGQRGGVARVPLPMRVPEEDRDDGRLVGPERLEERLHASGSVEQRPCHEPWCRDFVQPVSRPSSTR